MTNERYDETLPVTGADGVVTEVAVAAPDPLPADARLLVVLPPHPSLGGDGANPVVRALVAGAVARGWVAALPRYRGAGGEAIGGRHALAVWDAMDARQDYAAVEDDLVRASQAARAAFCPAAPILLAGYSFGVYPALRIWARLGAARLAGIAPPLSEHDFVAALAAAPRPAAAAFAAAAADPFCPGAALRAWAGTCGARADTLAAEDHFFRNDAERPAVWALAWLADDKPRRALDGQ